MAVSETDVEHVAELANLELSAGERSRMLRDLNSILDHVAQLNELDTASVTPMVQVAEQVGEWQASAASLATLRSDEIALSLERDEVLASAPDTDHVFFRVPKVIDR